MLTCEHEKASDTGQEQRRRPPTRPSEHKAGPRSSAGEEEGADPPGMGSVTQVFRPRTAAASRRGQGSPGLGGQALLGRAAAGLGPGGEHQCARSARPGPDSWRCHREAQVAQCWGWRRVGSRARAARPGRPVPFPSPLSANTWGSVGRQRAAGAGQDGELPWVQTPTLLCPRWGLDLGDVWPTPQLPVSKKNSPRKGSGGLWRRLPAKAGPGKGGVVSRGLQPARPGRCHWPRPWGRLPFPTTASRAGRQAAAPTRPVLGGPAGRGSSAQCGLPAGTPARTRASPPPSCAPVP